MISPIIKWGVPQLFTSKFIGHFILFASNRWLHLILTYLFVRCKYALAEPLWLKSLVFKTCSLFLGTPFLFVNWEVWKERIASKIGCFNHLSSFCLRRPKVSKTILIAFGVNLNVVLNLVVRGSPVCELLCYWGGNIEIVVLTAFVIRCLGPAWLWFERYISSFRGFILEPLSWCETASVKYTCIFEIKIWITVIHYQRDVVLVFAIL